MKIDAAQVFAAVSKPGAFVTEYLSELYGFSRPGGLKQPNR